MAYLLGGSGCRKADKEIGGQPSSCFECPYPDCIAKDEQMVKSHRLKPEMQKLRDEAILQDYAKGYHVKILAEKYGVSITTIRKVCRFMEGKE